MGATPTTPHQNPWSPSRRFELGDQIKVGSNYYEVVKVDNGFGLLGFKYDIYSKKKLDGGKVSGRGDEGTTANSAPTWPAVDGTETDGEITWRALAVEQSDASTQGTPDHSTNTKYRVGTVVRAGSTNARTLLSQNLRA